MNISKSKSCCTALAFMVFLVHSLQLLLLLLLSTFFQHKAFLFAKRSMYRNVVLIYCTMVLQSLLGALSSALVLYDLTQVKVASKWCFIFFCVSVAITEAIYVPLSVYVIQFMQNLDSFIANVSFDPSLFLKDEVTNLLALFFRFKSALDWFDIDTDIFDYEDLIAWLIKKEVLEVGLLMYRALVPQMISLLLMFNGMFVASFVVVFFNFVLKSKATDLVETKILLQASPDSKSGTETTFMEKCSYVAVESILV